MDVVGFLGGSHAQYEWYRESVAAQQVLTVADPLDLLVIIDNFLNFKKER